MLHSPSPSSVDVPRTIVNTTNTLEFDVKAGTNATSAFDAPVYPHKRKREESDVLVPQQPVQNKIIEEMLPEIEPQTSIYFCHLVLIHLL